MCNVLWFVSWPVSLSRSVNLSYVLVSQELKFVGRLDLQETNKSLVTKKGRDVD